MASSRIRTLIELSKNADFSNSQTATHTTTSTHDEGAPPGTMIDAVVAPGATVATAHLTTINEAVFFCPATNTADVTFVYRSIGGGANDQTQTIAAGKTVTLADLDPATAPTLTVASGTQPVEYYISAT